MADTSPPKAPDETVQRLAQLGLTWELLWHAIADGELARQSTTKFEPRPAAGLRDWIARVGALRSRLDHHEWQWVNNHHISLSVNKSRTVGVGVLLGNSITGTDWTREEPRSKYSKGPQVRKVGKDNALLRRSQVRPDHLDAEEIAGVQTWFLVTHRVIAPSEPPGGPDEAMVCSELSLPGPSASNTHIDTWLDRIPLPPTRFALADDVPGSDDDGDDVDGLSDWL